MPTLHTIAWRWRGMLFRLSSIVGIAAFIALGGSVTTFMVPAYAYAAAPQISLASVRSIDVMKYTKDVMTSQPTDADIASIVQAAKAANADYVALSIPLDATSNYPAGNVPAPRTAEAFTQAWANAVHAAGLHVIWRGTFSGIEGLYGFAAKVGANRFPAGTAASAATDGQSTWLGKIYAYVTAHPSYFADGDIWAPLPERTQGIFSDATSFLPSTGAGTQANYASFFINLKTVSDQAFSLIGRNVMTGLTTNNSSEVMSGWLPSSLYSTAGYTVIDYYGTTHTPAEMDHDLRAMYAATGKPIFLQEWSDYWDQGMDPVARAAYLSSMYAEMSKLASDGVLAGFNYWGGWNNNAEGILTKDASGFHLNAYGQILASFFATVSGQTQTVGSTGTQTGTTVTATTTTQGGTTTATSTQTNSGTVNTATSTTGTNPSTSSGQTTAQACPAPASNSFTACYYSGLTPAMSGASPILVNNVSQINISADSGSLAAGLPTTQYSARYQGDFSFDSGNYSFTVAADDGAKLYVDGNLLMDQWHDQAMNPSHTANITLPAGTHRIELDYYQAYGGAGAKLSWAKQAAPVSTATNSFSGVYYSGTNFGNQILTGNVASINFYSDSGSIVPGLPSTEYSARWTGSFDFTGGSHTFTVAADDGVRLYVDGNKVIDEWHDEAMNPPHTATVNLTQGTHTIVLEYYQAYGGAAAKLSWQ